MNDKQLYAIISEMKKKERLYINDMLAKGAVINSNPSAYHRAEGYAAGFNGAIQMLGRLAMDAELQAQAPANAPGGTDGEE